MKDASQRSKTFDSIALLFAASLLPATASASEQAQDAEFQRYRQEIKSAHGIDIAKYKEKLKGGRADGMPITKYDLGQLIKGIKVETEHSGDKMLALEISSDHLEEFPDYYTLLEKMEKEAEAAQKAVK